jgi:formylglycine-generating enzyme required for sulfatase activity
VWVHQQTGEVIAVAPAFRPAPAGFKAKPGTAAEPGGTGWAKEIIHEKTGIEMVFIPAGEFDMGSPEGEADRGPNEGPVHRVRITKPFYLGKHEVTKGEWEKATINDPNRFGAGSRRPVEEVSWENAQDFCRGAGSGLRLPTEAQWEYACRAGSQTRFSFGDDDGECGDYAWHRANSRNRTQEVGQKKPNAWGLYDMHGNILELCSDWYGKYEFPAGAVVTDPTGPGAGAFRVLRGGGWGSDPRNCRSAIRSRGTPDGRNGYVGFRVSLDFP